MKRLFVLLMLVNLMIVARLLYLGTDSTYAGTLDYLKAESCSNLEILDSRTKRMLEYEKGFLDDVSQTRAAGPVNVIGGEITTGVAVQNSGAIIEGGNSAAPAGYGEPVPVVAGAAARPTLPDVTTASPSNHDSRYEQIGRILNIETIEDAIIMPEPEPEPEPEPDPTPPPKEDPTPPSDPRDRQKGR
jgi:hypothetical protein